MIGEADREIRLKTFDWLTRQRDEFGETISRAALETFSLDGRRIPLVGPSGIWKPAVCELPLSITTTVGGPYEDTFDRGAGTLRYAYRGLDPQHRDNRGLRRAMVERVPIVYFHAIEPGRYVAALPGLRRRGSSGATPLLDAGRRPLRGGERAHRGRRRK